MQNTVSPPTVIHCCALPFLSENDFCQFVNFFFCYQSWNFPSITFSFWLFYTYLHPLIIGKITLFQISPPCFLIYLFMLYLFIHAQQYQNSILTPQVCARDPQRQPTNHTSHITIRESCGKHFGIIWESIHEWPARL